MVAKRNIQAWRITLPYAVYAVEVRDDTVTRAPPIAQWMTGRSFAVVKDWIYQRGGSFEKLPAK